MVCLAIFLLCIYFNFVSVFKRYCIWVAFCMCIAKLIMAVEYSVQKVVLNDRDALLLQIVLVDVHGVLTFLWGGIRSVFSAFASSMGSLFPSWSRLCNSNACMIQVCINLLDVAFSDFWSCQALALRGICWWPERSGSG